MNIAHTIKIDRVHYESVLIRNKRFEIRNNDRGYQTGEVVKMEPHDCSGMIKLTYLPPLIVKITYISNYNQPQNQVVWGFELLEAES